MDFVRRYHAELVRDLGTDFVTAGANGWSDSGSEIGWLSSELEGHGANGGLDDAGGGAFPSSVNGGDGATHGVGEEHGDTIGGLDANRDARRVLNQRIGIFRLLRLTVIRNDARGMNLMDGNDAGGKYGKAGGKIEVNEIQGCERGKIQVRRHLWYGVFMTG